MRLVLIAAALCLLSACGDGSGNGSATAGRSAGGSPAEVGPVKGIDRSYKGKAAPTATFKNPDGGEISLASFKGLPVLVNLWATWCAPCVKELPTIDALAQSHAVDGQLGVIAVSQDSGPQPSVKAFLDKLGVKDLGAFHDPDMGLSGGLGAEVLPTTVLFDAQGREVWRYVGDLDWTSAEAIKLLAEAGAAGK